MSRATLSWFGQIERHPVRRALIYVGDLAGDILVAAALATCLLIGVFIRVTDAPGPCAVAADFPSLADAVIPQLRPAS